jgi:hypothetical protein
MSNADLAVMFGGVFVFVVVILYITHKFVTVSNKVKEVCSSELPYKVDPVHTTTTVDVAIPDNKRCTHETIHIGPFETDEDAALLRVPDHFEPYCAPKRTYTKRSRYWTDKRKKAAAKKARKTKRKSK